MRYCLILYVKVILNKILLFFLYLLIYCYFVLFQFVCFLIISIFIVVIDNFIVLESLCEFLFNVIVIVIGSFDSDVKSYEQG